MRNLARAGASTRALNRSSRVSTPRTSVWLRGSAALTSLIAIASCSAPPGAEPADDDGADVPEYLGPATNGSGTPSPTQPGPGSTTPPSSSPSNTTGSSGTNNPPPASNGNEQTGGSNTPLTPTTPDNNNTGSNNGSNQGAAGSSMVPPASGNQGAGGANMGGDDGDDTDTPVDPPPSNGNPPPVTPPPVTPPPVTPPPEPVIDTDCPDGAFFCSGFEQSTFPVGTTNILGGTQIANAFQLDTSESNSGRQSLFFPLTNQAFSYRVTAIDVPVQAFWARVFLRTDTVFGDLGHDGVLAVSSGDRTVDNNNETRVEFAEQENTIVLNRSTDQVTFPIVRPTTLPANTWHCIEMRFDGNAGDAEVFANGQAIIRSVGNAQFRFQVKTFRVGSLQFHDPRNVWIDDVVLSTNRVGCN